MKTEFHKIAGKTNEEFASVNWPLDPSVIPNYTGINLCSVEGWAGRGRMTGNW